MQVDVSEVDDGRDLSYLHCPFLDPADFFLARAWLIWTPPLPARPPRPRYVRLPPSIPSDRVALDEWQHRYGIPPVERDVWLAAGLTRFHAHIADQCNRVGLNVADLALVVDGRRVEWWLRSGESAGTVLARLLNARSA